MQDVHSRNSCMTVVCGWTISAELISTDTSGFVKNSAFPMILPLPAITRRTLDSDQTNPLKLFERPYNSHDINVLMNEKNDKNDNTNILSTHFHTRYVICSP